MEPGSAACLLPFVLPEAPANQAHNPGPSTMSAQVAKPWTHLSPKEAQLVGKTLQNTSLKADLTGPAEGP